MKERVTILLWVLSVLVGCGTSSSSGLNSTEEQRSIEKRDTILIVNNYPNELCTVKNIQSFFNDLPAIKNAVVVDRFDMIDCSEYKRVETHRSELKNNLSNSCSIINALEEEKCYELKEVEQSCVLGVDWSIFGF